MTGARVSVEPNLDRACFFTYVYQFSRKNIKVEFWPKIPGNIPKHETLIWSLILSVYLSMTWRLLSIDLFVSFRLNRLFIKMLSYKLVMTDSEI